MKRKKTILKQIARPRVFIGSSTEGLEIARAVQAALYYDAEPILWCQGVFGLSGGTLETLVAECGNFDFAVFVLTADDLVRKQKQRGNAPRDNVLFELGLFMGHIGRERTFFIHCRTDDLLLPTDLAGVTSASYIPPSEPRYLHAALSVATSPVLSAIRTIGRRSTPVATGVFHSRETDELRTQVAEMRVLLSSFASYAQALPLKNSESAQRDAASGVTSLDILSGTWKGDPTGSTAWCLTRRGKPKFLYCYRGDGPPTGEFYNWCRTGNALSGRFFWFKQQDIYGYAWHEVLGDDLLRGGWWMGSEVPKHLVPKLPHVPGMVPLNWKKISDAVPAKAKEYFLKHYPHPPR